MTRNKFTFVTGWRSKFELNQIWFFIKIRTLQLTRVFFGELKNDCARFLISEFCNICFFKPFFTGIKLGVLLKWSRYFLWRINQRKVFVIIDMFSSEFVSEIYPVYLSVNTKSLLKDKQNNTELWNKKKRAKILWLKNQRVNICPYYTNAKRFGFKFPHQRPDLKRFFTYESLASRSVSLMRKNKPFQDH